MSDESNPNISDNLDPEKDTSVNSSASEPNSEQKVEIAKWIADGMGLSDVQKRINQDFGIVMTYMDVRFLVDDLDLTLTDPTKPEPANQDDDISESIRMRIPYPQGGSVQIEVDGVTPPGAMASGSVTFSTVSLKNGQLINSAGWQ